MKVVNCSIIGYEFHMWKYKIAMETFVRLSAKMATKF